MGERSPLVEPPGRESGERLKAEMSERGVTVADLSRMTGISERTITALRSGASAGSMATWRIISRRLGCGLSELAG